jgi:hypothetical protein
MQANIKAQLNSLSSNVSASEAQAQTISATELWSTSWQGSTHEAAAAPAHAAPSL